MDFEGFDGIPDDLPEEAKAGLQEAMKCAMLEATVSHIVYRTGFDGGESGTELFFTNEKARDSVMEHGEEAAENLCHIAVTSITDVIFHPLNMNPQ